MKSKKIKAILCGGLAATMMLGSGTTAFAKASKENISVSYQQILIFIDNDWFKTDKEPFTYNGTTYLPVRSVAEAIGMDVRWDQTSKTVYLTGKSKTYNSGYHSDLTYGHVANENIPISYQNIKININGTLLETDKEPFTYNGTTYLPVRAVAEAVGMDVKWHESKKTVFLTSKESVNTTTTTVTPSVYNDTKNSEREALLKELEKLEEELEEKQREREREREERQKRLAELEAELEQLQKEREAREKQKEQAEQDRANSQKTVQVLTEDGWVWMSKAEADAKKSSEKKVKILREGEGWIWVTEEEARQYQSEKNKTSNSTSSSAPATTGRYVIGSGWQTAEDLNKRTAAEKTGEVNTGTPRKVLRDGVGWVYEYD